MLDSLFNTELPLLVKLAVAFAIVLVLLLAVMWIFKRFGGDRLGASTPRGRQPRLAVIDAASIDGRRRLVLVRRDNVEHLVMIGGPSDVLIEQNIVRAVPVAAGREPAAQRPAGEAPQRPVPEAARGALDGLRSPAEPLPRAPRGEPALRRPDLDRTRGEAAGLAARPPMPDSMPEGRPPRMTAPRIEPRDMPVELEQAPPTADSSLASMAQKLESALRRPAPPPRVVAEPPPPPSLSEPTPPMAPEAGGNGAPAISVEPAPGSHAAMAPESSEAKAETPSSAAGKSMFDSLEEEMASLLNRSADAPDKKK